MRSLRDPRTDGEWQDAADAAYACLSLESARQYGFVTGGPTVNVGRCEEILAQAKARGLEPSHDAVERFAWEATGG